MAGIKKGNIIICINSGIKRVLAMVLICFLCCFKLFPQLIIDAGSDTIICSGKTIMLGGSPTALGGSGDYIYSWMPVTDIDDPSSPNPLCSAKETRTYTVSVIDDTNGGSASISVTITVNQSPQVDVGADQSICISGNVVNASLWGTISGVTNTGIWTSTGDGSFPAGNDILLTSYTLGKEDKGSDTVIIILTSTNNGICDPVSDSLNLFIYPKIIADAGKDTVICYNGEPIQLNGNVSGGTESGVWTTDGFGTFDPSSDLLNSYYIPQLADTIESFHLYLSSTKNKGCEGDRDSIMMTVVNRPEVSAGFDTIVNSRSVRLNGAATGFESISWSTDGSGTFYPSDSIIDPRYIFGTDEILTGREVDLILTTKNHKYCPDDSDTVKVMNISNSIPNVITPNDDGINDVFMVGEHLSVYNRWGQLIFKGMEGWDGKKKNEKVSPGTYFYIIRYYDQSKNESVLKGTVTVINN